MHSRKPSIEASSEEEKIGASNNIEEAEEKREISMVQHTFYPESNGEEENGVEDPAFILNDNKDESDINSYGDDYF